MKYDTQKYFLWVLGCQMNKSDGERVAAVLEELGFVPTTNESEANLIFTMACSVRQTAIDRIHGRLRNWEHMKRTRPILTVLSGCVLPDDKEYFRKKFDILLVKNADHSFACHEDKLANNIIAWLRKVKNGRA